MNSKPYICFAVSTLSQFQIESIHEHWIVENNILRYLHGIFNYLLRYASSGEIQLQGYMVSHLAGSVDDRKSTSSVCFNLGSTMISSMSMHQTSITLDTTEEKYIATCLACCEGIFHKILSELNWLCCFVTQSFVKLILSSTSFMISCRR